MAFNYASSGAGWRLAGSLIQLATEVAAAHHDFTCLGTIGDAAHRAEGSASDHNPFIKDPATGVGIVRAIDIGGPDAELKQLRQLLWNRYAAQDSRVYEFGYMKGCSDNLINNWGLPFRTHVDTGDAGHLHVSVTQKNGNSPSSAGYVAAIDSHASWGISSATVTPSGGGSTPVATSYPAARFTYPFSPPNHFGDINGNNQSHGGDPRFDSPVVINDIKLIQMRLNQIGLGALAVDGKFGPSTINAATAFQRKYRANGTTLWGQLWGDDCSTLFGVLHK